MIDNFDKIFDLLKFGEDTYYIVQIIQRRKDPGNERLDCGEVSRWFRFITKPEILKKSKIEIQELCKIYNARAYIELNPRSLEKYTILLATRLMNRIYYRDFSKVYNISNQVALTEETISTKTLIDKRRWMIDVDEKIDIPIVEKWVKENKIEVIKQIPTIHGAHIIVKSFDYRKVIDVGLGEDFKIGDTTTISLKSNCNTILYF